VAPAITTVFSEFVGFEAVIACSVLIVGVNAKENEHESKRQQTAKAPPL
jgi:hypothetical protein